MSYRYDKAAVRRAADVALATDVNQALSTTLDVHPALDEAAAAIGDSLAAVVVTNSASVLETLVRAVAQAGDDGVDVTAGLTTIGDNARQATAAAFLRGVLLGHALAEQET